MEKFQTFLRNLYTNLRGTLGRMPLWQKIGVGVGAVALVGTVVALIATRKEDPYEYAFRNLTHDDVTAITAWMNQNNYPDYQVDANGLKVRSADVMSLKLKMAQEGLPAHGVVGWEKFDSQDFTRTDFEQRINKQRAIQGELSRTIMMIDGVTSAKVHIVTPKKSLFLEDQIEPTAAVYLKTKPGVTLDKKTVRGIVHLISRSVEGLKPNNVTIIDAEGKMMTEIESEDPASKMTKEMLAYKRSVEKQYEENIRAIVGRVVGVDRVEAKVDAIVDFTQEQQTISDVDPDRVVVIGKESSGYSLSGTGLNPTGIPGSKSNVPGEQEQLAVSQSSTQNKKDSEVVNFEVSKKISQKTLPVGRIVKLSAAVLVDGKQDILSHGPGTFEARSEEEMQQIDSLVRSAVGYDDKRGDIITVRNMKFQLNENEIESIKEEKKETREYVTTLTISAAIAFALVLFFFGVARPYFRWLSYDPAKKEQEQVVEDFKPDLELGTMQNVHVKEDVPFEKLSPQEQVLYIAKNEPKRTVEAIRLMLNPHHSIT